MLGLQGSDKLSIIRGCPGLPGAAGPKGEAGVAGGRGTCWGGRPEPLPRQPLLEVGSGPVGLGRSLGLALLRASVHLGLKHP